MDKFKIIIPKQILFLTIIVVALVLGYTAWVDSAFFLYLIWNIFLAFLPFVISSFLLWYSNKNNKKNFLLCAGIFIWLILFPNAPYLITDIIHLNINPSVPLWFDMVLLFSSAYIGVYLGIHSLYHIEQIIQKYFNKSITKTLLLFSIFISSFGVYLGRFPRWNSWDLFIQPKNVLGDIWDVFQNPSDNQDAYTTTLIFFIFISVSYVFWKYTKKRANKKLK